MRKLFLALGFLLALPTLAMAQNAAAPADPADAGYRVVAISAGAVAGVIVANALTGGLATPVMTIGAGGGMAWDGGVALWSVISTAAGAVAGGYFGDWLYHR